MEGEMEKKGKRMGAEWQEKGTKDKEKGRM